MGAESSLEERLRKDRERAADNSARQVRQNRFDGDESQIIVMRTPIAWDTPNLVVQSFELIGCSAKDHEINIAALDQRLATEFMGLFPPESRFRILDSVDKNGWYTVVSSTPRADYLLDIVVVESFIDDINDGYLHTVNTSGIVIYESDVPVFPSLSAMFTPEGSWGGSGTKLDLLDGFGGPSLQSAIDLNNVDYNDQPIMFSNNASKGPFVLRVSGDDQRNPEITQGFCDVILTLFKIV